MAPSSARHGAETAAVILDYAHAPAIGFYFVASIIYSLATLQKPSSKAANGRKRRLSLALMLLIIIAYFGQGAFYLIRALTTDDAQTPQHSIIHVLGSILIWMCIQLSLVGRDEPVWRPYVGAWVVGALIEIPLLVLYTAALPNSKRDNFHQIPLALQSLRVACFAGLVVNGVFLMVGGRPEKHTDEERQSLLGNAENGDANGSAANANKNTTYGSTPASDSTDSAESDSGTEPEDRDKAIKEKQRKRLEEQGGWLGYLKGFTIFLPYLWPKDDWKAKVCLLILGFDIIQERFLNVLIPRQVGIITDKLTQGGVMPWKAVLLWSFLQWLGSFAGFGLIKDAASTHVTNYSYKRICDLAFSHVMNLSMDFHSNKDSGEVLKSVDQAHALNDLIELVLFDICPVLIDLVVAMWYVTHLFDIYLAFIVLVVGVVYIWLGITMTAWAQPLRRVYVEKARDESKTVYELIPNWQTVSYFNRAPYERERYGKSVQTKINARWAFIFRWYTGHASQALVMDVGFCACSLLAVWEISSGRKPVGNFVTFITYWGTMVRPLYTMASSYRHISSTLIDAERLLQLLTTKPSVVEPEIARELEVPAGRVEFENVAFSYDERKPVLKDISFVADPGKTVAFVGETGGGKSTLLKLLFRFYDVTGGSIKIDGQDLRSVNITSLRDAFGVVPQDPSLFNQTIIENIRYAKLDATDEEIEAACKAAAVHDKIMTFPDKYKSKVGERGVKLSGGELQRVAIARVLIKNPKIVMLDEATSAVDSSTEAQIQEAFERLSAGRTTFVVAHRLSTIMEADAIMVIDHGEIVERGTHEELIKKGGKYLELWTKQTAVRKTSKANSGDSTPEVDDLLINDIPAETYSQELAKSFAVEGAEGDPLVAIDDQLLLLPGPGEASSSTIADKDTESPESKNDDDDSEETPLLGVMPRPTFGSTTGESSQTKK